MSLIKEINPIDPDRWLEQFLRSTAYQDNQWRYQYVINGYREMSFLKAALNHTVYEPPRKFCHEHGVLDAVPYYYINQVITDGCQDIIDIGCGYNVFKELYPRIVGMDADPSSPADLRDYLDQCFVDGHQECYDAIISINVIHFSAIDTVAERFDWIRQMLRPGGRAFVSTNIETWLMHTPADICQDRLGQLTLDRAVQYIDHEIQSLGLDLLVYDWPILNAGLDHTIRDDLNGNIRVVFQK